MDQTDLFCSEMQLLLEGAAPVCKKPTGGCWFSGSSKAWVVFWNGWLRTLGLFFFFHVGRCFSGEQFGCRNPLFLMFFHCSHCPFRKTMQNNNPGGAGLGSPSGTLPTRDTLWLHFGVNLLPGYRCKTVSVSYGGKIKPFFQLPCRTY